MSRLTDTEKAYYALRDSLPPPTCPTIDFVLARLPPDDQEGREALERLRSYNRGLRNAAKAAMLLCLQYEASEVS